MTDEDRKAIADYRAKRGKGPFIAADAVAVSADDHVLLIRRVNPPGRGLLALPGGFVDPGETFLEAAARELFEETGLSPDCDAGPAPPHLLRDAPDRDPRARIVSVAYHFRLPFAARELAVAGGDDAADAAWFAVDPAWRPAHFFADHHAILRDFGLVAR